MLTCTPSVSAILPRLFPMASNSDLPVISGNVNSLRCPEITVVLVDSNGQDRTVDAHLDTGFAGELTLSMTAIEQLGLVPTGRSGQYRIGSGATVAFNTYRGTIRWRDEIRGIDVLESEITPLVGVGLLWNNNLSIDFRHGGDVTITELPDPAS